MIDFKFLFNKKQEDRKDKLKREILKIILVTKILQKDKPNHWVHLYNNFQIADLEVDLYYENVKRGEVILYQIIKDNHNIEKMKRVLKNAYIPFFEDVKYKIISLNDIGNTIKEIEEYVESII